MATLAPNPFLRYFTYSGTLAGLSGGYIQTKVSGTDTDKATHTTAVADVDLPNPILLDSDGSPIDDGGNKTGIFLGSGPYRFNLYNSSDVLIDQVDNIEGTSIDKTVGTIALLRAEESGPDYISVAGYYAVGDGGGGDFYWDDTVETGDDDLGTVIPANDGGGGWRRIYGNHLTFDMFGAGTTDYSTDDRDRIQNCIDAAETKGLWVYGNKAKKYAINTQVTIKHNVKVDFCGASVRMDYAGTYNDSIFQMGNNTKLMNISELAWRADNVPTGDPAVIGMIKIGEFYAKLSGSLNQYDNSYNSTYWEVGDVEIKNITAVSSFMTVNTDPRFDEVIFIVGGRNIRTDNISLDGLAADGIPVPYESCIRTEAGYDVNERRQGYDLIITNTYGTNLRAHNETGVVYIGGDRNTKIVNVHGTNCGASLGIIAGQLTTLQSDGLAGRAGVNIRAENIYGYNCQIYPGDTFSQLVSGVSINVTEPDALDDGAGKGKNRCVISVDGIFLKSTETLANKLSYGISINNKATNTTKRVSIKNFDVFYFPTGINEAIDSEQISWENGYSHHNGGNGGNISGKLGHFKNVKFTNNNQLGATSAVGSNGFGVRLECLGALFENCIFGDDTLAAGTETQLAAWSIGLNSARARFVNCLIGNYLSPYNDSYLKSGVTIYDIYVDQSCRGSKRNITSLVVDNAPDVAKVAAAVGTGATEDYVLNCSIVEVTGGQRTLSFDNSFSDTNFIVQAMAEAEANCGYTNKTVKSVDIITKDLAGSLVDVKFSAQVYGDYWTSLLSST